jgi:hypothetical protein
MRPACFPIMRKLSWVLLLPLFLLFAQQGELRHEYSHYGQAPAGSQKKAPESEHCPLCLAYAHLSGVAKSEVSAATLLSHLTFHFGPAFDVASADAAGLAPRSRGPPSL